MPLESEEFFIERIRHGMEIAGDTLSSDEKTILLTPVMQLAKDNLDENVRQQLQNLHRRGIEALRREYEYDVFGTRRLLSEWQVNGHAPPRNFDHRDVALHWKRMAVDMYNNSQCMITAVVQEWYLSVGQKQQLEAAKPPGCAAQAAVLFLLLIGFVILYFA